MAKKDTKETADAAVGRKINAILTKGNNEFAKEVDAEPLHLSLEEDPKVKVFNEVMRKQRLRKVN